jgi:hypothetical protein
MQLAVAGPAELVTCDQTIEDRIRCGKATGLRNLPFSDFDANDVWLTLVCIAQTLVCWAQALLLDGDLKVAEPKTLRYRLWHAAGRLVHHARRVILRFDRDWPWAGALVAAFRRLPVPGDRRRPATRPDSTAPACRASSRPPTAVPAGLGGTPSAPWCAPIWPPDHPEPSVGRVP